MLKARLATALTLLAAFIAAALFLPNRWWAALLLAVLALASWEWGALAGIRGTRRSLFVGAVLVSAWTIGQIAGEEGGGSNRQPAMEVAVYGASVAFWLLIALPWMMRRWLGASPVGSPAAPAAPSTTTRPSR